MVGHSVFFKVYTASEAYWTDIYDEETHDKYPCDEYSPTMMNCEIHPDLTVAYPKQETKKQISQPDQGDDSGLRGP